MYVLNLANVVLGGFLFQNNFINKITFHVFVKMKVNVAILMYLPFLPVLLFVMPSLKTIAHNCISSLYRSTNTHLSKSEHALFVDIPTAKRNYFSLTQ